MVKFCGKTLREKITPLKHIQLSEIFKEQQQHIKFEKIT